jgi:hypothetical protein
MDCYHYYCRWEGRDSCGSEWSRSAARLVDYVAAVVEGKSVACAGPTRSVSHDNGDVCVPRSVMVGIDQQALLLTNEGEVRRKNLRTQTVDDE